MGGQDLCGPNAPIRASVGSNTVADVLNWGLQQAGIRFIQHYLDDFIIMAPPHSDECQRAIQTLDEVCAQLGVLMAPHKQDFPTTRLIFLGIQIDTVSGELRLPEEKLQRLRTLLQEWGSRKTCQRKQLESLMKIGLLSHACKVVHSGRSFLCRLRDLLHTRLKGNSIIRLNKECRADIAWWEPPCR